MLVFDAVRGSDSLQARLVWWHRRGGKLDLRIEVWTSCIRARSLRSCRARQALLDDYANVLTSGKPMSVSGEEVPYMGGRDAQRMSWRVLDESRNTSWAARWRASCEAIARGDAPVAEVMHDEL